MERIELTKNQKKILMLVGIVGAAFVIFITLIYLPLRRELNKLKGELYLIESGISQIKKAVGEEKSLEEMFSFLKDRLDSINKRFPEKEELVLRELPSLTAKLGIEVSSVRPERKRTIQELAGTPINIKDCFVQEMPISMSLKTNYKTLGEFFKILREDFPVFVRVDNIRMGTARGESPGILNVELNLDTYLICPGAK